MNILGIALIVCGLTIVCASMIFLLIVGRERSASHESFEESSERRDDHIRGARRTPQDLDDKPEPTEHVPDDR
jgi:hypothetical protein